MPRRKEFLGYKPRPPPEGSGLSARQQAQAGPGIQSNPTWVLQKEHLTTSLRLIPKVTMAPTTTTATTTEPELLTTTNAPIDDWLSPSLQRFFAKTQGDWDTGCWNWTAAKDRDNYPRFWRHGTNMKAHRWIYESLMGPIPKGLELDHVCVNAKCVAPNHLEPVTKAENQRRKLFRKAEAAAGRPVRIKTGATAVQEITLAFALGLPIGGVLVLPARAGARAARSTSPAPFDTLPMSRLIQRDAG
ncbi:HNH endonuclease signature motif containing protein [Pseudarthrobacter sp. WHRI 8279]|uniref:HNH endonuclease signature motif containing protein n=1 Tax=Pseudarthrobacter sp. WHRI 8279 TaxID=3162566 RepID=UPI0035A889C8